MPRFFPRKFFGTSLLRPELNFRALRSLQHFWRLIRLQSGFFVNELYDTPSRNFPNPIAPEFNRCETIVRPIINHSQMSSTFKNALSCAYITFRFPSKNSSDSFQISIFLSRVVIHWIHETFGSYYCSSVNVDNTPTKNAENSLPVHLTFNPFQVRILAKYLVIDLNQIDFANLRE